MALKRFDLIEEHQHQVLSQDGLWVCFPNYRFGFTWKTSCSSNFTDKLREMYFIYETMWNSSLLNKYKLINRSKIRQSSQKAAHLPSHLTVEKVLKRNVSISQSDQTFLLSISFWLGDQNLKQPPRAGVSMTFKLFARRWNKHSVTCLLSAGEINKGKTDIYLIT